MLRTDVQYDKSSSTHHTSNIAGEASRMGTVCHEDDDMMRASCMVGVLSDNLYCLLFVTMTHHHPLRYMSSRLLHRTQMRGVNQAESDAC